MDGSSTNATNFTFQVLNLVDLVIAGSPSIKKYERDSYDFAYRVSALLREEMPLVTSSTLVTSLR